MEHYVYLLELDKSYQGSKNYIFGSLSEALAFGRQLESLSGTSSDRFRYWVREVDERASPTAHI